MALVIVLALVGYGGTLIATAPASLVLRLAAPDGPPPMIARISGTVWNGEAALAGGIAARWRTDLLASLAGLALVADLRVEGPTTDLAGRAALRSGGLALSDVAGVADWALARALAPGASIVCDQSARVALPDLGFDGAAFSGAGELRSGPGACAARGGEAVEVPPLTARLSTESGDLLAVVTRADRPGAAALGEARLTPDGALTLIIRAEGAALIPGMPRGGDSEIGMRLWHVTPPQGR